MDISDTVVGSLLGHKAHGMGVAASGELAHWGPLISVRIIEQHFRQPVATISTSCNDESLIVQTIDD